MSIWDEIHHQVESEARATHLAGSRENSYAARISGQMGYEVLVNGQPLPPRNDLRNHSPDGFSWGYSGSGPSQLALAILAFELGDEFAQKWYQEFKADIISGILDKEWQMTSLDIGYWMDWADAIPMEASKK